MKILAIIDLIGKWSGLVSRWFGLLLSAVVIFEVISRYLFNSPTIWAFDTAMILTSALFLLGAAYVHLADAHIRVDVIYNLMPDKGRKIIDIIFYLTCFFPFTIVMVWFGTKATKFAWMSGEISNTSQWGEPIFLWRALLPTAFLLLLLQGSAKFVRILASLISPGEENAS